MSLSDFEPEPEQLDALSRWLSTPTIVKRLALYMPLVGGTREACENRVREISRAIYLLYVEEMLMNLPNDHHADP
jgi:hypothetical protein